MRAAAQQDPREAHLTVHLDQEIRQLHRTDGRGDLVTQGGDIRRFRIGLQAGDAKPVLLDKHDPFGHRRRERTERRLQRVMQSRDKGVDRAGQPELAGQPILLSVPHRGWDQNVLLPTIRQALTRADRAIPQRALQHVAASNAPRAVSGVAAHSINGDHTLGNGLATPFGSDLPSAA